MTAKTHGVVQVIGLILQALNAFGGFVPPKYQPIVALVITTLQGTVAVINHYYNPDGTPASIAYVAKLLLLCLLLGSTASAQGQHFSASGNVVSFMGPTGSVPASVADGYFNVTKHVSLGYQQITIPSLATFKLGMVSGDCSLSGCLGKKLTSHLVFDATKPHLTFFGGAGKLTQASLNVNRIAEGVGVCLGYPVSGNVSLNLACGEYLHGGLVNGFLTTGIPGSAPTPGQPQSSTASAFSGVKVRF